MRQWIEVRLRVPKLGLQLAKSWWKSKFHYFRWVRLRRQWKYQPDTSKCQLPSSLIRCITKFVSLMMKPTLTTIIPAKKSKTSTTLNMWVPWQTQAHMVKTTWNRDYPHLNLQKLQSKKAAAHACQLSKILSQEDAISTSWFGAKFRESIYFCKIGRRRHISSRKLKQS